MSFHHKSAIKMSTNFLKKSLQTKEHNNHQANIAPDVAHAYQQKHERGFCERKLLCKVDSKRLNQKPLPFWLGDRIEAMIFSI
jgi:hypothetical protein